MTDIVFNVAKGKVGSYAELPAANDALIGIPIETTGLETDAVLKDKDTVADVLSGSTNEQTGMGRKTLTGVTSVTDDSADKKVVDFDNPVWTAPPAGNAISKLLVAYDPDTTGGTDGDLIPLLLLDFVGTPNGSSDLEYRVNAAGAYQAA